MSAIFPLREIDEIHSCIHLTTKGLCKRPLSKKSIKISILLSMAIIII